MSGIILMYHRVAALEQDAYGLAVHPRLFEEHVQELSRQGCVVPLTEILRPGRATRIAVTFDDGYADNATVAAPMLAAADLPATFFITTGRLGARRFWWDRLAGALLGDHPVPAGIDLNVGGRRLWLALNDDAARRTTLTFLHRRLRPLPPEELESTLENVLELIDSPVLPQDELTMTVEQLLAMAAIPLVEIGAHTRTHLQLADQSEALQRQEVAGSVADLAELLNRPIKCFAYPFGTRRAVGSVAPRLARDAGCIVACSTELGSVGRRSDAHRLPRMNVGNWTGEELVARLQRLVNLPAVANG